ncbi:MAG: DUF5335 family protein [Vicinamibacterales bacterium]
MSTREIPAANWAAFCDHVNRTQRDFAATLEVQSPDIGAQVEARNLPFDGIAADVKDARLSISVTLRAGTTGLLTHTVTAPLRLTAESSDEGLVEALLIEAANGLRTLVRLTSPR